MSKIREVIDNYTDGDCLYPIKDCELLTRWGRIEQCSSKEGAYKCLMKRLGELGVAIKVDRELPELEELDLTGLSEISKVGIIGERVGIQLGQQSLLNRGYVAVEPLIEEEE